MAGENKMPWIRVLSSIFLFLSGSLGVSNSVFAEDYYWQATGYAVTNSSLPSAACQKFMDYSNDGNTSSVFSMVSVSSSETTGVCNWKRVTNSNGYTVTGVQPLRRLGNGCAPPKVYDNATGICTDPAPSAGESCEGVGPDMKQRIINSVGLCVDFSMADKSAICKSWAGLGTQFPTFMIDFDQDGDPKAPANPEKFGCKVSVLDVSQCKLPPAKCSDGVCFPRDRSPCKVAASFTGEVADNGGTPQIANPGENKEGVCPDTGDCSLSDLPEVKEDKQCVYTTDAEGRKVCDSRQYSGEPGELNCGQINGGAYGCTAKVPNSNGIDISTKIDTSSNSDGSTTSTKTDVATKYDCSGKYSDCKVTTTTTTTTTTKNSAGEVTGSSSETTCKGDSCNGSSSGGGSGNGGKGDDTTNCDPATDPKACEGGSTDGGGKKCDASIRCDGDAVMCAILQQQHKDTCELMAEPSDEEKSKFEQDKNAEAAKVDQLQEQLDNKVSTIFANFQAKATGNQYGGRCLDDVSFSFMGSNFILPASQVCPYLALFRYAVVAMAYLAAARIVSRGI